MNKNNSNLLVTGNANLRRREKVKRLNFVGSEMGFDGQDELHHSTTVNSMKFKLPRKIFSDSNTSVPRKLRSVALPDGRRLNNRVNGVESLSKDCSKKSKICMQNAWSDNSARRNASVAISKDEEEVAETLFALAGMIPLDSLPVNKRTDNKSLQAKTSDLSKKQHSNSTPSEDPMVLKEETTATTPTATIDSSKRDSSQARSVIDPPPLILSTLSERRQMNLNLKVSVPPGHFQIPPLLRACDERQLKTNSNSVCASAEQSQESRLTETKQERRESHINIGVASLDRGPATSAVIRDNAWPSTSLPGSGVGVLPLQSSATFLPSWSNHTFPSKSGSCDDTRSAGKISCSINGGRKSWRRCVAHVYISRLIQVLQNSEGKDISPLAAGHVVGYQDDLKERLAAGNMVGSSAYKNFCETANDVSGLKNCQAEVARRSLSGCCDSKKQSYNFLSLSTGAGTEVNNGVNRLGITLEAKDHVHQMHSGAPSNSYVPSSLSQNRFPSIPYRDQVAGASGVSPSAPPQVHIQVPPYFSNHCGTAPSSSTRSTHQPHSKQQQQIWTAQLAAQFRPGPVLSSHIANWQNSRRDWGRNPHSMNHMPAQFSAPQPSLEMVGSKYLHISQQPQQQLFGLGPSLPTSNAKLQNGQRPLICEDKGARFHPDGVRPLQLLCNEQLLS
ncbi:uncharacterized protein LOC104908066 isoform X3 [Beta vulgaris subsp. vulgaris]|uniref:uncharacterized protein LOC104908066 isoform X3 n=1 Tax=Beta vulgaris subsp. vulgaris TaxID=3555 RepID=UPI0020373601|nr:uncharacterized protein LOC104908066 isoform X3 [Beta vulgaris subsp. vulgaris]